MLDYFNFRSTVQIPTFLKKKKVLVNAELEDVIMMIKTLLVPIVESIESNTDYSGTWDHSSHSWK
jgi:hypothetical protein